jgi:hypothetical protein
MHDDDDKNKPPAETDASSTVATPQQQIAAAPVAPTAVRCAGVLERLCQAPRPGGEGAG